MNMKETRVWTQAILLLLVATIVASLGCSNGKQGALSGAGIGALSGLAIGSLTGNAGKGAAIGAIVGGVGGAVIGDQNRRKDEAAAAAAQQPPPPQQVVIVAPQPYSTGQALGRLVGQWRVNGTIDTGSGATLPVYGTARGSVDKTYFVRIDLNFTDPRNGIPVQGTSVLSQTGVRGVQMTNSFSTSPAVKQFRGEMDPSGSLFDLRQFDPPYGSRRVMIHMSTSTQWTADVWEGSSRSESYTFTWVGP
jgi:hypothetical protein